MQYISDDEYRQMAINSNRSKAQELEKRLDDLEDLVEILEIRIRVLEGKKNDVYRD